jgi:hypothetical protein
MSNVRFVFPKHKLAEQLRQAGGLPVAEAVEAAQANLAELRPECLSELQALTGEAAACFEQFPAVFDPAPLRTLYGIASRGVGTGAVCGTPAADTALISLCNLLDYLQTTRRWDLDAVAVHVKTLQLLVGSAGQDLGEAASDAILSGLTQVSARYAQDPPA